MRILGIDYGDKKIGLAFGDFGSQVALPLDVIRNDGAFTLKALARRVESEQIDRIVVGVPLPTGGRFGPEQLQKTRAFIEALRKVVSVPVDEEDESFTTKDSIRLQREEGAEADEDALAAMIMVQSYVSRLSDTGHSASSETLEGS
ncbi:Holliday junction resolvase RuvX [Candidatus Uhrbacteria bacterium]|nr:Holliday junction resolvase RuvX [Candidatus Uhrbacteria bacterium]